MALKIRLKRLGKKNLPFYRLVVVDSHWRRDGKTISDVGWYDPVKQPAQMSLKEEEIIQWLQKGVQLSETVRSMLKKHGILEKFQSGAYKDGSVKIEAVVKTVPAASVIVDPETTIVGQLDPVKKEED